MLTPTKIDHTCLVVSSLADACEYYGRLFNFKISPRKNCSDTLVVESEHVRFFILEVPSVSNEFVQLQHLSFRVENLDQAIAQLEKLGITKLKTGQVDFLERDNYRWCEWRDPDGIRLECVEVL